jgi:hypothetical protein
MDLFLPSLRMPLTTMQNEGKDGIIHHIIREVHQDYESFRQAYECMAAA